MDSDHFDDSFFFCSRDDLEGLQLVRKRLRNTIVARSKVLPLRPIHSVYTTRFELDDTIQMFVVTDDYDPPDYHASVRDGDFAETFFRLQHTCIKSFYGRVCDSPFQRYWKADQTAAFTVVSIDFDPLETTDYDLLDSVMNHLRPRTTTEEVDVQESSWHENDNNSERLKLLTRESFLNNLQICRLSVQEGAFPPPSFILNGPGYRNYELRCENGQVADGIDGLIETFVREGCANKKLESVCVKWHEWVYEPSPMPKQLCKPTKIDVPLPQNGMTTLLGPEAHRVSSCEMHSFVNTKQWQQIEAFKWSVEYDFGVTRRTTHVLQCRVKNVF